MSKNVCVVRVCDELMLPVLEDLAARLGAEVGDSFHASATNGVLIYRTVSDATVEAGQAAARIMTASERGIPPLNSWDF